MTATAAKRGLHAKLAEVMDEVGRIPKNGTAPAQMGGYKFVQVGDAADAIRKALGSRGVSMLPTAVEVISESEHETRSGGTMTTQTVRTTWTLVDGDSGESAVIQSLGTGADSGDKFSPKAQSNAMKYALLMGFLLSTGDDPEGASTEERGARRAAAPTEQVEPALIPLGEQTHTGRVAKGDGTHNDLEFHADPNGYKFGFKLVIGDGQSIPQVICTGALGTALLASGVSLLGQTVTVTGEAFRVEQPGRRPYRRLMVEAIEGDGFKIPAGPYAIEPVDKIDDLDQLPF